VSGMALPHQILAALDILVCLELANGVEADKNVRAPVALLHVVG